MEYTHEQIQQVGFQLKAAPPEAWRSYDAQNPVPGYFQFDWLSARHPDLYHAFALSTVGLMEELNQLVDLSGLEVLDIGAGTGRSALAAARKAKCVTAVDAYAAVVAFGRERAARAGLHNVIYARGDAFHLPFASSSFDACLCSWAVMNYAEAYRVLKPGGCLVQLGAAPGALCGELTAVLAPEYPQIITEVGPAERYAAGCPAEDEISNAAEWNGLPVTPPTLSHRFTYRCDYGDPREAAAIYGRLYGPKASQYLLDRGQSGLAWRLSIEICRVRK